MTTTRNFPAIGVGMHVRIADHVQGFAGLTGVVTEIRPRQSVSFASGQTATALQEFIVAVITGDAYANGNFQLFALTRDEMVVQS